MSAEQQDIEQKAKDIFGFSTPQEEPEIDPKESSTLNGKYYGLDIDQRQWLKNIKLAEIGSWGTVEKLIELIEGVEADLLDLVATAKQLRKELDGKPTLGEDEMQERMKEYFSKQFEQKGPSDYV